MTGVSVHSPAGRILVGAAFCLSGAAALIYQVAWQRLLVLQSGVGVYSVALITAAFMAGLGIGSRVGASLSVGLTPSAALKAFAGLECGVAAFAALSPWLYHDVLYQRAHDLYSGPWQTGLLHLASLLLPTTLMGMTLPFLVRAMVRDARTAGRTVADVYAVNVVGAGLGALVAPWILIRYLGIEGAVWTGCGANVLAATLAATLRVSATPGAPDPAPGVPRDPGTRLTPFAFWLALYALSGFCALSLEVLWFRVLEISTKGTAFTFGTLLAVYLGGLACGSFLGARLAPRLTRPLHAFVSCQTSLLCWSALALWAAASLPPGTPGYSWFARYWSQGGGLSLGQEFELGAFLRLYLLWPGLLYGIPTILMGLSFAVLQQAVQDDPRTSGRKAGLLQAANIAGCMAGSLAAGLVGLDWWGTTGTLRAAVLAGLVFVAVGWWTYGRSRSLVAFAAALGAAAWVVPSQERLWSRLHGLERPDALVDEDATAVIALTSRGEGTYWLWMAGKSQSQLPFGGIHTLLGAMPAIVHPAPREVAIVGLGSGDTAWAAACRPDTARVTVFELSTPQQRLLRRIAPEPGLTALRSFLEDERVSLVFADGRNRLLREDTHYDVIEADALLPEVSGSGNLYSVEFFRLVLRRLKPGGLACTWAPTARSAAAFARVFPSVLAFRQGQNLVLVGSRSPLPLDVASWRQRALLAGRYLGEGRAREVLQALQHASALDTASLSALAPNQDLFPRDEFATP